MTMLRYLKTIVSSNMITVILLLIFLSCWFYIDYTTPRNMQSTYEGIKYQNGNAEKAEAITIQVNGEYKRSLMGREDIFKGIIIMGSESFDFSQHPLILNRNTIMALNDDQSVHYGMLFAENRFNKFTIEIHEHEGNGIYQSNGWYISGPCNNRIQAVEISNMLMKKIYKKPIIY